MATLSPDGWQELSPYLYAALGMEDRARGDWLALLRENDPALASHFESLLREHQALLREHFLEKGARIISARTAGDG